MNIISIICHDLGRELGCYGAAVRTPNLDRFAAEGVRFNQAFTNSPACSPSRGCIMTGQYAHTNGLMGLVNSGWSMPTSTRTVVDHLNDAGYHTAHFGLQHEREPIHDNRYQLEGAGSKYVEDVVPRAIDYLRQRTASKQPFYLNLGTHEVHESRWSSLDQVGRGAMYGADEPADVVVPPFLPDVPQVRREIGRFRACTRFYDRHLGVLFEAIAGLGLDQNTLVVFITDHGISGVRAKGTLYDAGVEISLLMRLPATISNSFSKGVQVNHLIQTIDITPTLLDAAGVPIPAELQGKSFWPLVTGGNYEPHDTIFTERNYHGGHPSHVPLPIGEDPPRSYDPMRAVRTPQFHYIRNFRPDLKRSWRPDELTVSDFRDHFSAWYNELWPPANEPREPEELYDVEADPYEWNNLASHPGYQDIRAGLADRLQHWMAATDDPILRGRIPDRLNPHPPYARAQ